MRRHARSFALITAVAAGLAGFALAQEGAKMGVINAQEVLEKSVEGKRAIAQLQAADKKYGDAIILLDDQIRQLQSRLSAQRLTLTAEAAAGIQGEIQKKQTERQRSIEDASRIMQELQATTMAKIEADLMPLIEQLRKDKGLDLIFDLTKTVPFYHNPAIDLTAEVVKRYDALKAAPPVKK
jgi:Skp family chaperone for outer membrane proteins